VHEIGVRIVDGQLKPGETLPDNGFGEAEVSRTVVREAIKVLAAKGLVESRPKVGTRVPTLGLDSTSPFAASTLTASRTTVRLTSSSSRKPLSGSVSPGFSSPLRICTPISWTTAPWSPRRGYVRRLVIR